MYVYNKSTFVWMETVKMFTNAWGVCVTRSKWNFNNPWNNIKNGVKYWVDLIKKTVP